MYICNIFGADLLINYKLYNLNNLECKVYTLLVKTLKKFKFSIHFMFTQCKIGKMLNF